MNLVEKATEKYQHFFMIMISKELKKFSNSYQKQQKGLNVKQKYWHILKENKKISTLF